MNTALCCSDHIPPWHNHLVSCIVAGASALDKRAAKAWKAGMLARLGAAADKAPRTPASLGIGMAKKAKQREAAALQEAIAAGMVQAKGRGAKARALKGAVQCHACSVHTWSRHLGAGFGGNMPASAVHGISSTSELRLMPEK